MHFAVGEGGRITGTGKLHVTPPFLNDVDADLTLAEDGNLNGTVTVAMTETKSPIPALSLTGGTLSVSYANGAVSGSLTEFPCRLSRPRRRHRFRRRSRTARSRARATSR